LYTSVYEKQTAIYKIIKNVREVSSFMQECKRCKFLYTKRIKNIREISSCIQECKRGTLTFK